ncbi:hypothetical protein IMSHALPRED_009696 [Imshaugia aleurites]|uniref:Uncharacterized protein n=1 Tax=Imshaugia aleurites TaxID=172621 RepID=A0A8H3ING1_9LECA|nr:hypothetical protein IMSHALPRED_009696 [Imshaugia aleurites]
MHLTFILPFLALAITTLSAPLETRKWGPDEYYSLGCPTNTTKPYASQYEQTEVLNTFANEVFVHQEVALGYDTYAAVNFINHAPEVSGNGTAIVIPFQTAELKGGSVDLQRVFVGTNLTGTSFGTIHFRGNSVAFGEGDIAGIWRMIGTCLVEYWDVASGVEASANPIAYF